MGSKPVRRPAAPRFVNAQLRADLSLIGLLACVALLAALPAIFFL